MVADIDIWIVEYVRRHENTSQRHLLEAAIKERVSSDRTIRAHISKLDGKSVRRIRDGREVRFQSMELWRQEEVQTFDLRVPHTVKLKGVLDQFRSQLPILEELGIRGRDGFEYRPDAKLGSEQHPLFGDLLNHLGQLPLIVNPGNAWSEFKSLTSRFLIARDALWARCTEIASKATRLPYGRSWTGEMVSEHCVALFCHRALASAEDPAVEANPFRDAKIVPVGDGLEYWLSGRGMFRRKTRKNASTENQLQEETKKLQQALRGVTRPEIVKLATSVIEPADLLRMVLEKLQLALQEADYYEVFPGACRFTGSPSVPSGAVVPDSGSIPSRPGRGLAPQDRWFGGSPP